jgi:hypothetical protein
MIDILFSFEALLFFDGAARKPERDSGPELPLTLSPVQLKISVHCCGLVQYPCSQFFKSKIRARYQDHAISTCCNTLPAIPLLGRGNTSKHDETVRPA